MPLSDHEQRQLEQLEKQLLEHRRFARRVRSAEPSVHYRRRLTRAGASVLVGAGLLAAGIVLKIVPMIAGGGVLIAASIAWSITIYRGMSGMTTGRVVRWRRFRRPGGLSFMERLEERWRRRQEEDR